MKLALKVALFLWCAGYIPPEAVMAQPDHVKYAVSFNGALKPVKVDVVSGRLCRSHRGTARIANISDTPRCREVEHSPVGIPSDR